MTPAKAAHAMAQQYELETRQALENAIQALRKAGADAEAVRLYLTRCAGAGRVLEVAGVLDSPGGFER